MRRWAPSDLPKMTRREGDRIGMRSRSTTLRRAANAGIGVVTTRSDVVNREPEGVRGRYWAPKLHRELR